MGAIEAIRTLGFGIILLVFLVPILLNTLIPGLQATLAGQPWGNVILLVFMSFGFFVAVAVIIGVVKSIYSPSRPEIEMRTQPLNIFRRGP